MAAEIHPMQLAIHSRQEFTSITGKLNAFAQTPRPGHRDDRQAHASTRAPRKASEQLSRFLQMVEQNSAMIWQSTVSGPNDSLLV